MDLPGALRSFLEHLPIAAYVQDGDRRMVYLNPAAARLTGWTLPEVLGQRCENIFGTAKDTCPAFCAILAGVKTVEPFDRTIKIRSGQDCKVRVSPLPLTAGSEVGAVVLLEPCPPGRQEAQGRPADKEAMAAAVAGQRWAEAALKAQERFIESVFDTIQDGISVLDPDLTIRRVNGVMKQWYAGRLPLEGRRCYTCYHERIGPCSPCPSMRCMQTGQVEREIVPGPKGTAIEWIELFSLPMKAPGSGKVLQVVEFVRDITAKVRSEAQLQRMQKLEALSTLAGGIAHQLNNALSVVRGSLDLMKLNGGGTTVPDKGRERLASAAETMTRLTEQLTAYALGGRYNVVAIAPAVLVRDTVERLGASLGAGIRVEADLADDLPPVAVDVTQMQLALSNLIRNAAEAQGATGRVRLAGRRFDGAPPVDGATAGGYVLLSIEDDGCGMDSGVCSRMFDPFFSTKGFGRGLGAAAVYGIVAGHGGWIDVRSIPGKGTRVAFYLPAAATLGPFGAAVSGQQPTVLVVEDEPMVLEIVAALLERMGYSALTAADGRTASELAADRALRIDAALVDLNLPDMDGRMLLTTLRQQRPVLKIIACSGTEDHGVLNYGADAFLQKPFSMDRLGAVLAGLSAAADRPA